jgi:hypothetical protein
MKDHGPILNGELNGSMQHHLFQFLVVHRGFTPAARHRALRVLTLARLLDMAVAAPIEQLRRIGALGAGLGDASAVCWRSTEGSVKP